MRWPRVNRRKAVTQLQQRNDEYLRLLRAGVTSAFLGRTDYWWGVADGFAAAALVIQGEK